MAYELYWNGVNGFCHADDKYGAFLTKPALNFGFSVVFYHSNSESKKAHNGVVTALTSDELAECQRFAIANSTQGVPSGVEIPPYKP